MLRNPSKHSVLALAAALMALLAGCTSARPAHLAHAGAPGLSDDAPLGSRGGANPNAPYTLVDHSARLVKRTALIDINAASPCAAAALSLFESGAHVDGDRRSVRLSLVNHAAEPCRVGGYPAVSLLHSDGTLIGSIAIEKITAATLEAALHPGPVPVPAGDPALQPSAYVLLAPGGEAAFEVGWTSGATCPKVGAIAVAAPGTLQSFTVHHELSICDGRILVTAIGDGAQL